MQHRLQGDVLSRGPGSQWMSLFNKLLLLRRIDKKRKMKTGQRETVQFFACACVCGYGNNTYRLVCPFNLITWLES